MKPVETSYKLAASSKDYRDCLRLAREEGQDVACLHFPTVVARNTQGEVLGFFSTVPDSRYVIAGPLVVRGGRRPVLAMRLMEAYDRVMASVGVTLYYFTVRSDRTDALASERLEAMGMKHWQTRNGISWFRKELINGRQNERASAAAIG